MANSWRVIEEWGHHFHGVVDATRRNSFYLPYEIVIDLRRQEEILRRYGMFDAANATQEVADNYRLGYRIPDPHGFGGEDLPEPSEPRRIPVGPDVRMLYPHG